MLYDTLFPNVETPLSEGGAWGNSVPATWTAAIQSLGGRASGIGQVFNDSVSRLNGAWGPDQYIKTVVSRVAVTANSELEHHHRMTMVPGAPDKIFTYELDWTVGFVQFVRWDGPQGTFTPLGASSVAVPILNDGDILESWSIGQPPNVNLICNYNGVQKINIFDTDAVKGLGAGNPGIGTDQAAGSGDGTDLGFKSYHASDGLGGGGGGVGDLLGRFPWWYTMPRWMWPLRPRPRLGYCA